MGNIFSIQLSCDTIITRCWDCVAGQAAFICKLEDNLAALKTEVEKLKARSEGVMTRVRVAEEQQQLKPLTEVEEWCSSAETVIKKADLLIEEGCQQKYKLCMGGCCSRHPRSSHKFGKLIAKTLQEVKDQWSVGDFDTVADRAPLPSMTIRPNEPTVGLESTFDEAWCSLQEKQVGIIGLYGLGGVGKTTLLNQINNKFLDTTIDFDYVIWVVVSQNFQIDEVQNDIGKRIGFSNKDWKEKSFDEKAGDILSVLRKKKFALLLDDIWERIDLTRVGVPLPTQANGSKVIFTTRSIDVCFQMGAHKIKVQCLQQREALKLFEEKVGAETLESDPKIRELAEAVAEECAGLPLALITIGRALSSKKKPEEWEYAIGILRQSAGSVFPGVGKEMYPKLKFSYNCLPDERVRSCFLYCSLYPEDYLILRRDLIECWIGEGFLDKNTNFNSARNQGHYILRSLVDACLLEEEGDVHVKMHDVIRDMALWIADESANEKFLVKAGMQLKKQPTFEKWQNVKRVSLMRNEIENLSEILVCPNLQTLFLNSNNLKLINNDFFNFMPMLMVLDLSGNFFSGELPVGIAKLVSLEHLNLSHTGIREMPVEMNALEKLKYLNLEWTDNLEMIPEQLISNFSKLQVLKMQECGCEWSVEEIEHLKDLEVLTITFQSASMLERALVSSKFKSCNVEDVTLEGFRGSRSLNILGLANLQHLSALTLMECKDMEEVKMERAGIASAGCFRSLLQVELFNCSKLRDASWVIFAPHLENLIIFECPNLEEIISEEKVDELMGNSNFFSKLKFLELRDLPKLKTIYRDALPFPQLKEIIIKRCPMLKRLPLNSDSAKGQKIVVKGEEEWWKEVEWEDEATRTAFLPSFKRYAVKWSPKLKMRGCGCEWSVEEIEHLNDLEVLTITLRSAFMLERALVSSKFKSCNVEAVTLKGFEGSRSSNILGLANLQHLYELYIFRCPDLEEVKLERFWIASAGCFHSLRQVNIRNCSKLRDASWVIFAPHLETLIIGKCPNLEEIISEEKVDEVGKLMGNSNLFSKLKHLHLFILPKLKTIYRDALPLPQLKLIYISRCPMLKKLPLSSESAKGQKIVIKGKEEWWKEVEWEDEASRTAFLPSFKPCYY